MNLRELAIDLSDNAASMKHLKKAKNTAVIQNIFYGLGAACIVYTELLLSLIKITLK